MLYAHKEDYAWKLTPNKHGFVYPREYADGILTSHLYSGQWDDGWVARVLRLPSITGWYVDNAFEVISFGIHSIVSKL